MADHLDLKPEAIERITSRPVATLSLDQQNLRSDDGGILSDVLPDPAGPLLEQVESTEQLEQLLRAVHQLDGRAQRIIFDQFFSATPSTLQQLATAENVNRETIRAIIHRSLLRLRLILGGLQSPQPPTCEPVQQGMQLALFGLLD